MNQISTEQNSQKQLERLAAQRELYSSAKKWHGFQIILTVIVPVILAGLAFILNDFAVIAAIFGVASFLIDISIIEPVIKKRKTKAAKIQELFDCDILHLPKSPLKTVDDITVEEVLLYYNAHIKIATNVEKIKDWYSPKVSQLPIKIARILCQRTNCWWDSKLRERYSSFLKYASLIVFVVMMIAGYISNLSLIEITLIAGGLVPFFQFCIKQCNDNLDAANRLNDLVNYSSQIWDDALENKYSDDLLKANSRRLQDEIFEHRSKSPLILDLYYNVFRDSDEALMNRSSEILVDEALNRP
ncbi:MAG TPA: S-4TM family putative pore-forming effector [Flavipsychrobacter sp.]|nr:S-4TM family putative pore-forming effector [Flavipsychrobacter sp.]